MQWCRFQLSAVRIFLIKSNCWQFTAVAVNGPMACNILIIKIGIYYHLPVDKYWVIFHWKHIRPNKQKINFFSLFSTNGFACLYKSKSVYRHTVDVINFKHPNFNSHTKTTKNYITSQTHSTNKFNYANIRAEHEQLFRVNKILLNIIFKLPSWKNANENNQHLDFRISIQWHIPMVNLSHVL